MEPRVQYAKTEDGVNIAFWTLGQGTALVQTPLDLNLSHIQLEWQNPMARRWYESLAETRMVVRYDHRGNGLSDREVNDYSLDALVLDLQAVADRLNLERFALMGSWSCGLVAAAYAAKRPERVSHLILWCSATRTLDLWEPKHIRALEALLDIDWETATDTWARLVSQPEGPQARWAAAFVRESTTPEALRGMADANRDVDVRPLLPSLRSPTLILSRRQVSTQDMVRFARDLATRIPDARLTVLEGASGSPFEGDMGSVLSAIDEFLGEGDEAATRAELPEGTAVILFADIAGSTALTEQLGDAAFRAKARELDTSLRSVIREAGGTPVEGKVLGDGVMAVFTSARQAIECALRCNAAAQDSGLSLHLGIHAGDVIREGNTVYGGAVNIAARTAAASQPGEVLVSDIVRGLARTSANVVFEDRGEQELKGVSETQRLFAVRGGG
jgi:class 3 adenylate cyclase/pimeloyl-ACP methyl ester carboxylesterase